MSELCAAVAFAQTEKLEYFVKKRMESGREFYKLLNNSKNNLLISQEIPKV